MLFVYKEDEIWLVDRGRSTLVWAFGKGMDINYNRIMGYLPEVLIYYEFYFIKDYRIPTDKSVLFIDGLAKIITKETGRAISKASALRILGMKTQIIRTTCELKSCVSSLVELLNLMRNFKLHITVYK